MVLQVLDLPVNGGYIKDKFIQLPPKRKRIILLHSTAQLLNNVAVLN